MIDNGPVIRKSVNDNTSETVAVVASATGQSAAWRLIDVDTFALTYQVACTGTPNIKLQLQQSVDGTNWFIADTMADINSSVTDKNLHGVQLFPITAQYMRIQVVELTTTVADSVVTFQLSVQKRFSA